MDNSFDDIYSSRDRDTFGRIRAFAIMALIVMIATSCLVGCSGNSDKKEDDDEKETKVEYLADSPLGIAETYVGKDVTGLITAVGTLKGDPTVKPTNDGGGYEGTYEFDGFTAYTYAKSANAKNIVTEIVPDESSKVYKKSIKTQDSGGGGSGAGSSGEFKKKVSVKEDGEYDSKDKVAAYIKKYKKLPKNYITKKEAKNLGWSGGSLEDYAPGKSIGGDSFGNREGKLPKKDGRKYKECDIETKGAKSRGAKRIVYSNDGLIYYTDDHYSTFEKL